MLVGVPVGVPAGAEGRRRQDGPGLVWGSAWLCDRPVALETEVLCCASSAPLLLSTSVRVLTWPTAPAFRARSVSAPVSASLCLTFPQELGLPLRAESSPSAWAPGPGPRRPVRWTARPFRAFGVHTPCTGL